MLAETNNILDKTYLTKNEAVELFRNYIREHIKRYQYDDITSYLKDVCFLQLQPAGKSQNIIVDMISNIQKMIIEERNPMLAKLISRKYNEFVRKDWEILNIG